MAPATFVVEGARPLSRSLLWRLQRNFFDRHGAQSWSAGLVPHYITSNPWIADGYAKAVLGWLRDGVAVGAIDPAQPLHIVELGCGSGRFGYIFLTRLLGLLGRSSLAHLTLRYVLTDFTDSTLDPLVSHPSLQPLVETGRLDFARYDAGQDLEIRLRHSGETLGPGALGNPLVVIANYVFDGLPQDCFHVQGGEIREDWATLLSTQPEPLLDDPELLERLEVSWEERPTAPGRYGDPDLDRLLESYADWLDDTHLLFPAAALRALLNLSRLASGRLLLLSADKGYAREEALHGREAPELVVHGSFSLMVNFHALGRFFMDRGGEFLATSLETADLVVATALLGAPAGGAIETRLAFEESIERRNPEDFFTMKIAVESSYRSLSLPQLLAWLRLSGWDSNVFLGCLQVLLAECETATAAEREELRRIAHRVWESYFPIREPSDLAFQIGTLLCQLEVYEEALPYFERSIVFYGPNPATLYNLGLCQFCLGRLPEALALAEEALAASPDLDAAVTLKEEIEAVLATAEEEG
jgi:tetratricopeptide (TPR) repeat protein